ncbi:MAG: hypothetical protein ACLQPN_20420 [Bryobacteraceae bacterium]
MRLRVIATTVFLAATGAAQIPSTAPEQIGAMKSCSFLAGQWAGEGWMSFGPGKPSTFHETESVAPKLDGLVLEIQGLGTGDAGKVVHSALAILSFDGQTKQYHFRAYDGTGHFVDADASCKDGAIIWTLPMGPRQMRYTIRLNQKGQWFEVGEMSGDSQKWQKFFEMTLSKSEGRP